MTRLFRRGASSFFSFKINQVYRYAVWVWLHYFRRSSGDDRAGTAFGCALFSAGIGRCCGKIIAKQVGEIIVWYLYHSDPGRAWSGADAADILWPADCSEWHYWVIGHSPTQYWSIRCRCDYYWVYLWCLFYGNVPWRLFNGAQRSAWSRCGLWFLTVAGIPLYPFPSVDAFCITRHC